MIIYIGNDPDIKKRMAEPCYLSIFAEKNITVSKNSKESYPEVFLENQSSIVLVFEGNILFPRDVSGILNLYKRYNDDFILYINGIFNLLLWDKVDNKMIIANDKLGLLPFYYHKMKDSSELLFSTKIKDIMELAKFDKTINKKALAQFALFNYITNRDTFITGIYQFMPATRIIWQNNEISETSYYSLTKYFNEEPISEEELMNEFPEVMLKSICDWAADKKRIGILLSGGYDSRVLLACLMKIGIKGYAYTWHNPKVKEGFIAQRLALSAGFVHKFLPYYPEDNKAPENIYEVGAATEFTFPLFHIGRYYAVKKIAPEVDILFSGQGEIIRSIAIPNDYINSALTSYFISEMIPPSKEAHFFYLSDYEPDLLLNAQYRTLSFTQKLTHFLINYAYRFDYGVLRYGESHQGLVAMPFLDSRVIEILLRSPLSIARLKTWGKNIYATFATRKIYFNVIKRYAPALLELPVDRGYPQKYDCGLIGLFMTGLWGMRNLLNATRIAKTEISTPWRVFINKILSEAKTLKREFYNREKITRKLGDEKKWDPRESYELEKIARFELWFRYFIENSV